MEISNDGQVSKLVRTGEATKEELTQAWEEIIRLNSLANGSRSYNNYFTALKNYIKLVNSYMLIRLALIKCAVFPVDYEVIADLRLRGYKINLNSNELYSGSIETGLRRVENLITRANMKRKELETLLDTNKEQVKGSYEEIIANTSAGLGFPLPTDLTLAMYNAYRKVLKAKATKAKRNGRN